MKSYDLVMLHKAFCYAKKCHALQKRKYSNVPYITHPAAVNARAMCLDEYTVNMGVAALLHDVIEDCDITQGDLVYEGFPRGAIDYILLLTNESKKPEHKNKPRRERKLIDFKKISRAPRPVKLLKYIDRIHNLSTMQAAPRDFLNLYIEESELLVKDFGLFGLENTLDMEYNAVLDSLYIE